MVDFTGLKDELLGAIQNNSNAVKIGSISALTGATVAGAAVAVVKSRKKRTKRKSTSRSRSYQRKSYKRKSQRRYKYARTAGKRKDKSTIRIRMTKSGQPYIILKTGKARFISKKSARISKKRKGGRY